MRLTRRRLALGAALVLLALGAAWALLQATASGSEAQRVALPAALAALVLEVPAGDLTIRGATGAPGADARLRSFFVRPGQDLKLAGERAELRYGCRWWTSCAVDVRAVLPAAAEVDARTPFGDIRVDGLAGALRLETRSGAVTGTGLGSGRVRVQTTSGDTELTFAAPPEDLAVTTGSGDVTLIVPPGSYRVDARSVAGDVVLEGVTDDRGAPRRLAVASDAGEVRILAATAPPISRGGGVAPPGGP